MKKHKVDLIKFLKLRKDTMTLVRIPYALFNQINLFVELCAMHNITVMNMISFVFGIGYELLESFFHRGDIKNLMEMLECVRYMRIHFDEVLQYGGREWFFESKCLIRITELCDSKKVKYSDFFNFIDANKNELIGVNKCLLTVEKVEAIFKIYESGL